eukprot:gene13059-biopygen466
MIHAWLVKSCYIQSPRPRRQIRVFFWIRVSTKKKHPKCSMGASLRTIQAAPSRLLGPSLQSWKGVIGVARQREQLNLKETSDLESVGLAGLAERAGLEGLVVLEGHVGLVGPEGLAGPAVHAGCRAREAPRAQNGDRGVPPPPCWPAATLGDTH